MYVYILHASRHAVWYATQASDSCGELCGWGEGSSGIVSYAGLGSDVALNDSRCDSVNWSMAWKKSEKSTYAPTRPSASNSIFSERREDLWKGDSSPLRLDSLLFVYVLVKSDKFVFAFVWVCEFVCVALELVRSGNMGREIVDEDFDSGGGMITESGSFKLVVLLRCSSSDLTSGSIVHPEVGLLMAFGSR